MEYRREGNILMVKLDHGTDIFDALSDLFKDTQGAMVVSGIGMLKDFQLGYYDSESGEYQWKEYHDCMELLSLCGSAAKDGSIHLHAVVSGQDHAAIGGHLKGGMIHNVVELTAIVPEKIRLQRKLDERTGTKLLSIE